MKGEPGASPGRSGHCERKRLLLGRCPAARGVYHNTLPAAEGRAEEVEPRVRIPALCKLACAFQGKAGSFCGVRRAALQVICGDAGP
jgi:hypothetical protein